MWRATRPLAGYHLFYATRADMLERAGGDPRPDLERAISLATNDGERRLLERRLGERMGVGATVAEANSRRQ